MSSPSAPMRKFEPVPQLGTLRPPWAASPSVRLPQWANKSPPPALTLTSSGVTMLNTVSIQATGTVSNLAAVATGNPLAVFTTLSSTMASSAWMVPTAVAVPSTVLAPARARTAETASSV